MTLASHTPLLRLALVIAALTLGSAGLNGCAHHNDDVKRSATYESESSSTTIKAEDDMVTPLPPADGTATKSETHRSSSKRIERTVTE